MYKYKYIFNIAHTKMGPVCLSAIISARVEHPQKGRRKAREQKETADTNVCDGAKAALP